MLTPMDSISKYHLSVREDGLWNVIDKATGGPAELEVDGACVLLFRLSKGEAEEWSKLLNGGETGLFHHKNPSR